MSPLERARANVEALRVLKSLVDEGREPSEAEARTLGAYSGWGGAPDAFREDFAGMPGFAAVNAELRGLLSEEEYALARASTLSAFYTPSAVIRAMEGALGEIGFGLDPSRPERVLEPGCGTGNFIGEARRSGLALSFDGIEVDPVSAEIAGFLNPEASIVSGGFEDCYVSPGSYDAAVGNVPYSDAVKIEDRASGRVLPIHDWFIRHAVEAVRPGGVVAVLTSRFTLDKTGAGFRRELASIADLVGCVRLPEETFAAQAGTEALSDILVLRRRGEGDPAPEADPEWVGTADFGGVPVNAWIAGHPEAVVGSMSVARGRFGNEIAVASGMTAEEIGAAAGRALSLQLSALGNVREKVGPRGESPRCALRPSEPTAFEHVVDEAGNVWYGNGELVEPVVPAGKDGPERLAAMLRLRDGARGLLALEQRPDAYEDEVADAIRDLSDRYDEFVGRFGRLCERANKSLFKNPDNSLYQLFVLENLDSQGRFASKADILSKRIMAPAPPMPDRVEDPLDALSVSLDRRGKVDLALVARLLGTDPDGALDALGDSVVTDPDSGEPVLAEAYLSGNVGSKLRRVEAELAREASAAGEAALSAWLRETGIARAASEASGGAAVEKLVSSGAWNSALRPSSSTVAVDVRAWFESVNEELGGWRRSSGQVADAFVRFLRETTPETGQVVVDEDGLFDDGGWAAAGIMRTALHYFAGHASDDPPLRLHPAFLLRDAVANEAVSLPTVGRILLASDPPLAAAAAALAGIELAGSGARPARYGRRAPDASAAECLEVARALRERPEIAEFLCERAISAFATGGGRAAARSLEDAAAQAADGTFDAFASERAAFMHDALSSAPTCIR